MSPVRGRTERASRQRRLDLLPNLRTMIGDSRRREAGGKILTLYECKAGHEASLRAEMKARRADVLPATLR